MGSKARKPFCTCWFCGGEMIWGADFDFEDYGREGSGVVATLTCSNCGADAEFYSGEDNVGAAEVYDNGKTHHSFNTRETDCGRRILGHDYVNGDWWEDVTCPDCLEAGMINILHRQAKFMRLHPDGAEGNSDRTEEDRLMQHAADIWRALKAAAIVKDDEDGHKNL